MLTRTEELAQEAADREELQRLRGINKVLQISLNNSIAEAKEYQKIAEDAQNTLIALEEFRATPKNAEAHLKQHPALTQNMMMMFAEILLDAPNYVEAKYELRSAPENWIVVTVQRGTGKTPHELRKQAEARIVELEAQIEREEGDGK